MKLVGLVHFMKTGSIMATNAIAFQVDTKIQLRGMGLFGSKLNHHTFSVDIKIYNDVNQCLIEETKKYKSIGSSKPIKQFFSKPLQLKPIRSTTSQQYSKAEAHTLVPTTSQLSNPMIKILLQSLSLSPIMILRKMLLRRDSFHLYTL